MSDKVPHFLYTHFWLAWILAGCMVVTAGQLSGCGKGSSAMALADADTPSVSALSGTTQGNAYVLSWPLPTQSGHSLFRLTQIVETPDAQFQKATYLDERMCHGGTCRFTDEFAALPLSGRIGYTLELLNPDNGNPVETSPTNWLVTQTPDGRDLVFYISPVVEEGGDSVKVFVDASIKNVGTGSLEICMPRLYDDSLALSLVMPSGTTRETRSYQSVLGSSGESLVMPSKVVLNSGETISTRIAISPNTYHINPDQDSIDEAPNVWFWSSVFPNGNGLNYFSESGAYHISGTYSCKSGDRTIELISSPADFQTDGYSGTSQAEADGIRMQIIPYRSTLTAGSEIFWSVRVQNTSDFLNTFTYYGSSVDWCRLDDWNQNVVKQTTYAYHGLADYSTIRLAPHAFFEGPYYFSETALLPQGEYHITCSMDMNNESLTATQKIIVE